tara:strand:- start:446 stop:865 length:420 start_codon:yes stop_codon:yes gene_type:complete
MIKNLTTLLLTLLVSGGLWADDEIPSDYQFPIEITCENGAEITYLHLEKSKKDSWFMFHESTQRPGVFGSIKRFLGKKGNINKLVYDPNYFQACTKGGVASSECYLVNRYTLKFSTNFGEPAHDGGQCYKGFKEYEKQI